MYFTFTHLLQSTFIDIFKYKNLHLSLQSCFFFFWSLMIHIQTALWHDFHVNTFLVKPLFLDSYLQQILLKGGGQLDLKFSAVILNLWSRNTFLFLKYLLRKVIFLTYFVYLCTILKVKSKRTTF